MYKNFIQIANDSHNLSKKIESFIDWILIHFAHFTNREYKIFFETLLEIQKIWYKILFNGN